MNKETKAYINNVMHGRDFILDVINFLLGFIILVLIVINEVGLASGVYYIHIFTLGTILAVLNAVKKMRSKSSTALLFMIFAAIMLISAILCYINL